MYLKKTLQFNLGNDEIRKSAVKIFIYAYLYLSKC